MSQDNRDLIIGEVVIDDDSNSSSNDFKDDVDCDRPIASQTSPHRYVQDTVIGNGAYGTVYMAQNIQTGQVVAMKKIRIPNSGGIPMSTLREITMMKKIDRFEHPNIIRLLDVCNGLRGQPGEKELFLYLIYEHIEQDLSSYLDKLPRCGLSETSIKSITHQMICGIDFLHTNGALHRDLKPQNILISNNERVKLADFGLAKSYNQEMRLTSVVVTLWYRSPEVLLSGQYSSPVDIWSIGCIMAEMYTLEPLFKGSSECDQLDKIFKILGSPDISEWPSEALNYAQFAGRKSIPFQQILPRLTPLGNDFLSKMLMFDPSKRITAQEALVHPYLSDSVYTTPSLNFQR